MGNKKSLSFESSSKVFRPIRFVSLHTNPTSRLCFQQSQNGDLG